MSIRLKSLDGLRGIAILTVILNHVPLGIWSDSIPKFFSPFLAMILVSGRIGVSILFLLTGFLMAWIYPSVNSPISFWSRRYARLFPAFIVMVISLSLLKLLSPSSLILRILLVTTVALIARIFWDLCQKISPKYQVGKKLTYFWLFTQIGVALWYSLYLLKIPSPVFYQTWNLNLQLFVTALVNATLTLPFGNYIGQIDGVYWSLITETLFYILYPILFLPLFQIAKNSRSLSLKVLMFLSTLPFCIALHYSFNYLMGFGIILPHLLVYFVAGVALGSNLTWFQQKISKFPKLFFSPLTLFLLLFISLSGPLIYPFLSKPLEYWYSIILVFPLSLLLVSLTLKSTSWSKILETRPLVFLGKYSYSLYLTHALGITLAQKFILPNTVLNGFFLLIFSIIFSILLAWILFHLVEAPYYRLPKSTGLNNPTNNNQKFLSPKFILVIFSLFSLLILYLGFRTPVSLFTKVTHQKTDQHFSIFPTEKKISLSPSNPVKFTFVADNNRMGMITSHIYNLNSSSSNSVLTISLLNSEDQLISKSSFNPSEIIENRSHPFGFPIEENSKGKTHHLVFEIVSSDPAATVNLITTESDYNIVYFYEKGELLRNPVRLISWLSAKILEPTTNPMFWFALINMTPLLVLLWIQSSPRRSLASFHS